MVGGGGICGAGAEVGGEDGRGVVVEADEELMRMRRDVMRLKLERESLGDGDHVRSRDKSMWGTSLAAPSPR